MAILITDPSVEQRLIEERQARGADHHDEMWEGIYMMAPLANDEHQELVGRLTAVLADVVEWPGLGRVRPGVNLSDLIDDWEHDYRVPDVAVLLQGSRGENLDTHWRGAVDFLVEIITPGDRTREKLPFYERLGVRELLLVDRRPWGLELYRHTAGRLELVGQSLPPSGQSIISQVLPLCFRLVADQPRPRIEVRRTDADRVWLV